MKRLLFSFLILAAIAVAVGFAASFEAADRAADARASATDQDNHSPPAAADVELISMIREMAVPAVEPSVGMTVLNTKAFALQPEKELEGYTSVTLKPKIETGPSNTSLRLGYSGLGGNHYARADV